MQLNHLAKNHRSRGFTLLEVLVAMVVLSIGLLGLSGLQTSSLRNNHSAFLRSQATLVSNDIIDRMRANRDSASGGAYDIVYAATPTSSTCTSGCSATNVANADLVEWRSYVERLPGGQGEIDVIQVPVTMGAVSVNVDVAEVKVRWGDARDGNLLEIVTRSQL